MRTLIFSDTHLSHRFHPSKFSLLKNIISRSNRVIINGDFWDSYITTFDRFMRSPWKNLFPLLKSKHAVYLYGNHDPKNLSDRRVSLFSDKQLDEYRIPWKKFILIIHHGHRHSRLLRFGEKIPYIKKLTFPFVAAESLGVRLFGQKFKSLLFYETRTHKGLMNAAAKNSSAEILICGHSHVPSHNPRIRYFNSGYIRHNQASYLEISPRSITLTKNGLPTIFSPRTPNLA